jgi:hypothetical protein
MLTSPQSLEVDRGATVRLVCEFHADGFNLFDNPIVWRKYQRVRHRSPSATVAPPGAVRVPFVDIQVDDDFVDDDDDESDFSTVVRSTDTVEMSQVLVWLHQAS